jgi:hypothetical protein
MQKQVYRSIIEIERELFPKSYRKRLEEKKEKIPGAFGSDLAKEFLEKLKSELDKS